MSFAEIALVVGIGFALAPVLFGVSWLLAKRRPPAPPEDLKSDVHRLCAYLAGKPTGDEAPHRAIQLLEELLLERAAVKQWELDQRAKDGAR